MFSLQMPSFSSLPNIFGTSSFTPPSAFYPSSCSQYYRPTMPAPEPSYNDDNDDNNVDDDDDPHLVPPSSHYTRPRRQRRRPHCGTLSHK